MGEFSSEAKSVAFRWRNCLAIARWLSAYYLGRGPGAYLCMAYNFLRTDLALWRRVRCRKPTPRECRMAAQLAAAMARGGLDAVAAGPHRLSGAPIWRFEAPRPPSPNLGR